LAGPVVAAAVILPGEFHHEWLDDSKKLSPERRAEVKVAIESCPGVVWAVGEATVEEIEIHNILRASLLAMRRAVDQLDPAADFLLIDGKHGLRMMPERTVVKGDATCRSIAAASILAKEYRDALMVRLAVLYPEYGFGQHRGYGTRQHLAAVERLGLCPIHRRSFFRKRLAANPALF
jgi:ribonuclease HII